MTRFTDPQCVTKDGENMTFKTRPGIDLAAVLAAAPGLVVQARASLTTTSSLLAAKTLSPQVKALAAQYFLTGKSGPSSGELKVMRGVITKTLNGLSGDISIKIGKLVGKNDKDVWGSVRQVRANGQTLKSHHNVVTDMGSTKFPWQKKKAYIAHAMRIDEGAILGSLGLLTMIHEATHKYAGTNDYCYFDEDDGVTPEGTFTSKSKALENADSYAYFTIKAAGG